VSDYISVLNCRDIFYSFFFMLIFIGLFMFAKVQEDLKNDMPEMKFC